MLNVKNLFAGYGNINVIHNINIDIDKVGVYGLIGINGAGKSTILKVISGLIKPTYGKIVYKNIDISKEKIYNIVNMGIALCPEGRRLFADITVKENLIIGSYLKKKININQFEFILESFPSLKKKINQYAGTLSGGEQQMLAIGRSLMSEPKLLLLDEPSLGLSPIATQELFYFIKQLSMIQNITILVVDQNINITLKISDYSYIISKGNLILQGDSLHLIKEDYKNLFYQ